MSRTIRTQAEAENASTEVTEDAGSGGEQGTEHANESASSNLEAGGPETVETPKDDEVPVEPNQNTGSSTDSLSPKEKDAATVEAISQTSVFD